MTKIICSYTIVLFFIFLVLPVSNIFADSYIVTGNEIIKKIHHDIILIKDKHEDLKGFDESSLNKMPKHEIISITYGSPWIKTGEKEGIYIHIVYSKSPVIFKTWDCVPTIFYILDKDLYIGYLVWAKPKIEAELIQIIEKHMR
ncbi:MAG: hypothetical protein Q8O30_11900 [Candidatus Omnitrophota bacterium]|nr:hypothetical protein [Candidatus Omnitrophota bacterium]